GPPVIGRRPRAVSRLPDRADQAATMVTVPAPPAAFVHVAAVPRAVVPPQPNVLPVAVTNADQAYAAAGCVSGEILALPEHASTIWFDAGVGFVSPLISCTVTVALFPPPVHVTLTFDGDPLAAAPGASPTASGAATARAAAIRASVERDVMFCLLGRVR